MCVNVIFLHFGSHLRLQKEARQDVFVFWAEKDIKRRANSSPFYTHDIVWWKAGFYTKQNDAIIINTWSCLIKNDQFNNDAIEDRYIYINSGRSTNHAL